jgi:predicted amidophosphoribosyltransferase
MLLAHKERGVLRLAGPLGAALGAAVAALLRVLGVRPLGLLLVPVPSRRSAVRARGHDPTARLAVRAAAGVGAHVRAARLLRHRRAVLDQAGLGAAQRAANLDGALVVPALRGRLATRVRDPVVVVDDLVTTGASLAEATRALGVAGFTVLGSAVVAATAGRSLAVDARLG